MNLCARVEYGVAMSEVFNRILYEFPEYIRSELKLIITIPRYSIILFSNFQMLSGYGLIQKNRVDKEL